MEEEFMEQLPQLLTAVAIVAGLIGFRIKNKQPKGKGTIILFVLLVLVVIYHLITSYSDHSLAGVVLRLLTASVGLICVPSMIRSIRGGISAGIGGQWWPIVPMGSTLLKVAGWLLQAMAYLVVFCTIWATVPQALGRYLYGAGEMHSWLTSVASVLLDIFNVLWSIGFWVGLCALGVCIPLLVARVITRWRRRRAARNNTP